ncbi:MAG: dihydrolipoyl dehydrogenase [Comamonadaceae bacterium]|jgi:dihydrolipoamide dehydrogenase|nr:dihydrolipoyl dehydrogenase [Comamonadaceae bacterium]
MSAPAVSTDLLVIGGGVGGYTAAIRAARSGLKVLLIEASELGGTCLNRGCIPTKSLLQQGHDFRRAQGMRAFGIQADSLRLNYALVRQRKDQVVAQLVQGVRSLVRKNNIELLSGMAELEDAHTARIRSSDQRVSFKRLLIATGSEPAGLTVPGVNLPGVINSDQALTLSELPASVLILGGGVIGLEFAQIYSDFGVPVTVAEARPALIAQEDPDIVAVLQQALAQQGVEFHLGALATSIQAHGQQLQVQLKIDGRANSLAAHQVLVAVGRRPLSRGLGLERLGVKLQGQAVLIDEVCRTNLAHVYAVGDVCGGAMLAHRASAQAEVAVAHMLGQVRSQEALVIPRAVYTSPEIATVGLTETQARAQGLSLKVGRFPFAASGKALVMGQAQGFVKVIADAQTEQVLGVGMVGPEVSQLLGEATLAVQMELTLPALMQTVHAHPTLTEALMEAAHDAYDGAAIHMPPILQPQAV